MPDTESASLNYRRIIKEALPKPVEIAVKTIGSITSNEIKAAFSPANLPKVEAIAFTGNRSIHSSALNASIKKSLVGRICG